MAIYKRKNYCRSRITDISPENGDEFINCNFSRSVPNTKIFEGVTGLKFTQCNLLNCDIPVDAVKVDCLHIQKSICSHLHQNRLDAGEIPECADNCTHVVDTDEITIDGVLIHTIYHYKDMVL